MKKKQTNKEYQNVGEKIYLKFRAACASAHIVGDSHDFVVGRVTDAQLPGHASPLLAAAAQDFPHRRQNLDPSHARCQWLLQDDERLADVAEEGKLQGAGGAAAIALAVIRFLLTVENLGAVGVTYLQTEDIE